MPKVYLKNRERGGCGEGGTVKSYRAGKKKEREKKKKERENTFIKKTPSG